jgi:hypothetical protein
VSATLILPGSVEAPDVPAWSLLQRAQGYLQKWPEGFERREPERRTLTPTEEYARATPGRVLLASRRTSTHEVRTDRCVGREVLHEAHCRIEHVWLPASSHLESETALGTRACRVELFGHQVL